MGNLVTPHALITDTGTKDYRYLISGIDTLDLGLYVDWDIAWAEIQPQLMLLLERSKQGETAIWRHDLIDAAVVTSSSKRNYRYRVGLPDCNLFIADSMDYKSFPNVYLSPTAKSLWTSGMDAVVDGIINLLSEFGATIDKVQVSRCDLAADFYIDGGLTYDFLRSHRVSRSKAGNQYEYDATLETYYVGTKSAPLQARIYDKFKAVMKRPESAFFLNLWGGPVEAWRVEFQIRRAKLREFGIHTIDDLKAHSGGLWSYLTNDWLSFRLADSTNTKRRTVHPWWQAVQNLADLFGPACTLTRDLSDMPKVPADWYIAHIAGCMPALAARLGIASFQEAHAMLGELLNERYGVFGWQDQYAKQRIRLQQPVEDDEEGGCNAPF
jgi:hypothetical protein